MIMALASCHVDSCAEVRVHELSDLRFHQGDPICELCYDEVRSEAEYEQPPWDKLPPVTLADLVAT